MRDVFGCWPRTPAGLDQHVCGGRRYRRQPTRTMANDVAVSCAQAASPHFRQCSLWRAMVPTGSVLAPDAALPPWPVHHPGRFAAARSPCPRCPGGHPAPTFAPGHPAAGSATAEGSPCCGPAPDRCPPAHPERGDPAGDAADAQTNGSLARGREARKSRPEVTLPPGIDRPRSPTASPARPAPPGSPGPRGAQPALACDAPGSTARQPGR